MDQLSLQIQFTSCSNGYMVQSIADLTEEPEVPVSVPGPATFFSLSCRWSLVLVNSLGCLNLPRNSVVKLTESPNMTINFNIFLSRQLIATRNKCEGNMKYFRIFL